MSEEFCSGVKVLLERMETNPEEFVSASDGLEGSKWVNFLPFSDPDDMAYTNLDIDYPEQYLTKEECEALRAGVRKVYADTYSHRILETLMDAKPKRKR
jgi:hypothetical protein